MSLLKEQPESPVYKYDPVAKTRVVNARGWADFFGNKYTGACAVNKCELKTSGCAEAYAGTNLKIADATNTEGRFPITAVVDAGAKPGYKESVCVSCSTAEQTVTAPLTVQQSSRCLETITSVEGEKVIHLELDAAATEMTTLSQWDFAKMFVNSDKENCPIS
jgi:hypothetical protein